MVSNMKSNSEIQNKNSINSVG